MDRPFFPLAAQLVSVFRQTQSTDHRISDEQNHLLWAKSSSSRPADGRSDKTPIGAKPQWSGRPRWQWLVTEAVAVFLLLMLLVGLPRLIGLSEKRVSFDQFAQLDRTRQAAPGQLSGRHHRR